MTVREIVDKIIEKTGVEPLPEDKTCDHLMTGSWDMEVKGVVTTFMATVDVIKEASALGANFIITHEPTWFSGADDTEWLLEDPVYLEKKKLIEENHIAIWRFHDHMHMDKEDGIGGRPGAGDISARTEGINDLQKQIRMLTQQLSSGVDHLGTEIGDIVRKLADLDGQIQQVQAQQEQQVQVQQEQLQQMQAQVQEEERPAEDGESLKDQLDTLRLSLEDTVHKENIKCFRNIQGALEEQGDGRSYDLNALRKYLKVIVWFQLITIALIVLRILGLL